jgi:hypothetical protein
MATTTVSATAATMVSTKEKGEVFSDWPLWICLAAAGMEKTKRYGDSRGRRSFWGCCKYWGVILAKHLEPHFYIYSIVKTIIKNTFGLSEDQ